MVIKIIPLQNVDDLRASYPDTTITIDYGLMSCEEGNNITVEELVNSFQIPIFPYTDVEVTFCVNFIDDDCSSQSTTTVFIGKSYLF